MNVLEFSGHTPSRARRRFEEQRSAIMHAEPDALGRGAARGVERNESVLAIPAGTLELFEGENELPILRERLLPLSEERRAPAQLVNSDVVMPLPGNSTQGANELPEYELPPLSIVNPVSHGAYP
jgi:hypothetical protein